MASGEEIGMAGAFAELAEELRQRTPEEKAELMHLLQRDLVEVRRDEMKLRADEATREHERGWLEFSSDMADLKRSLGVRAIKLRGA